MSSHPQDQDDAARAHVYAAETKDMRYRIRACPHWSAAESLSAEEFVPVPGKPLPIVRCRPSKPESVSLPLKNTPEESPMRLFCLQPINWTRLTLHSASWPPATVRPKAPPNPAACESAVKTPDSRGRISNRSSESLSSGSHGRSLRRRCSATEP